MRTLIVAVLVCVSGVASAQSNAELATRIAGLEARMAQLEGGGTRQGATPHVNATPPSSPKALDIANWAKCRSGLKREELIELLGEPTTRNFSSAVNNYPSSESLVYGTPINTPGGHVHLMNNVVVSCNAMGFPP